MIYRSLVIVCIFGCAHAADVTAKETKVDFANQIRPILSDKCFACHGPDENTREADLRLDVREDAVSAEAFVEGDADASEMIARVIATDHSEVMPPPETNKQLSPKEISLLRDWINQGAEYQKHWSYRELVRPNVPDVDQDSAIDAFVSRKLSANGLGFSPQADPTTLCRRLYLDLVGMPPSQEELNTFLNDKSEEAVENLVDRLLADFRFGERMAVYWLDLVRYADTIGYHSDTYMEVSAYRDYVINSFNQNQPFDKFTIEQLAGDLLPNPTLQQKIASGYNRLLQTTEEGGAQAKEYIAIYAADRVRNVSGVWLGQTVGCAQCHDHKYDPITAKDFYSMAAFFADIKEKAVGKRAPNLRIYSEAEKKEIAQLKDTLENLKLENLLKSDLELAARLSEGQEKWEAESIASLGQTPWNVPEPTRVAAPNNVKLIRQDDGSYLHTGATPNSGDYSVEIETTGTVRAIRLEVLTDKSFPRKDSFSHGNGNFVLTSFAVTSNDMPVKIAAAKASFEQKGWPIANTLDKDSKSGWAVEGHVKNAKRHAAIFTLKEPLEFGDAKGLLTIQLKHDSVHTKHLVGRFRLSLSDKADVEFGDESFPDSIVAALRVASKDRNDAQKTTLKDYYRSIASELEPTRKRRADSEKRIQQIENGLQTTLVSERMTPRMTRMLPRGNWLDDSGDIVEPAVPAFLPQPKFEGRGTRLDLAKWIIDKNNPLTSRTFANRMWKLFFGQGLSANLDDLGGQGKPPSHPELLDWLSVEFRDGGWNVKDLVKTLVMSKAYQQSSNTSADLRSSDPSNQWYARQGRWRVEAEFVRDTGLFLGRLLVTDEPGGKSIKPYQPAGYWQHLNFPKRKWQPSDGPSQYRRGLYTFWCRSFLHPSMLAFDAPSREECTAQRARSNIPQQALVLLNDPMFVEAARSFGLRIMNSSDDDSKRIAWGFREATCRMPTSAESELLVNLLAAQRKHFSASPEAAAELLRVGAMETPADVSPVELASWTQVARALLNAYETTSRF